MKEIILSVLLLTFVLLGCATTKDASKQEKAKDTIHSYAIFLATSPNSEFTNEAKNRLGELSKVEADRRAKIKSILSSYKVGHTTFAEFKRDLVAGSWETGNYKVNEFHRIEEGKSALEGKVLGSKASITVIYSSRKYCHLKFKGEAELKSAVLVSIKFIQ